MEKAKILIVEDEKVFALHVQKSLKKLGYTFSAQASSGRECLNIAAQMQPDLVLMDISLKGDMDGIETAQQIYTFFDIPVIYLTASSDWETLERAKITDPFGYLVKPFDLNTLHFTIEMALYKYQLESKVKKSEELYRSFVQNFRGITYRSDINFKPIFIHGAVNSITGYSEEEISLGKPRWDQLIHPKDLPQIFGNDEICSVPNYSNDREYRIIRKDGQIRWVQEIVQNICDGHEKPMAVQGIIFDITERKWTEKENESLKQQIEFILNSTKTVIDIIDDQFNLRFVDNEQKKIYGDPTGKKCYEYFMDRKEPCFDCSVKKKGIAIGEQVLVKENNRPIQITSIPFQNDENELLFAKVKVDITERKRSEERLQSTLAMLRKALGGIIEAMALTVETRDPYTAGHQRRVADLARAIADEMNLPREKVEGIRMAGVIHDLGKISVPAEILSKPGKISDIEFDLIKTHSQVGYDILKTIEFPWPVAQIVYQHHERMDGSGYPLRISGENILIEARILAVADVVEAMSTHRPYRQALGIEKALEEISRNKGIIYDPEVVEACLKIFTEKGYKFK